MAILIWKKGRGSKWGSPLHKSTFMYMYFSGDHWETQGNLNTNSTYRGSKSGCPPKRPLVLCTTKYPVGRTRFCTWRTFQSTAIRMFNIHQHPALRSLRLLGFPHQAHWLFLIFFVSFDGLFQFFWVICYFFSQVQIGQWLAIEILEKAQESKCPM